MPCCSKPHAYYPPAVCLGCGTILEADQFQAVREKALKVLYFILGAGVAALALILLMLTKVFFGW